MFYSYRERSNAHAVYTLAFELWPDTIVYIGHCRLQRVYDIPDARGDSLVSGHIDNGYKHHVRVIHITNNAEEAQQLVDMLLLGMSPEVRHTNHPDRRKRRELEAVVETTTDMEFDSAAEAARHFGINPTLVSRCLRRVPHYKRVGKGRWRFRYAHEMD